MRGREGEIESATQEEEGEIKFSSRGKPATTGQWVIPPSCTLEHQRETIPGGEGGLEEGAFSFLHPGIALHQFWVQERVLRDAVFYPLEEPGREGGKPRRALFTSFAKLYQDTSSLCVCGEGEINRERREMPVF